MDDEPVPTSRSRARVQRGRSLRVTERDERILAFVAEHRLVLAWHVQALLEISPGGARARLAALSDAGVLSRRRVFHGRPPCYQATSKGLAVIDSDLPRPRLDLRCYHHDVGVAWLWLAARRGVFGSLHQVLGERRLRSHDARAGAEAEPLGVKLGGPGPCGGDRIHYPDLLLLTADGRRIALELELSTKGRARREGILGAYATDARIDGVVYFVARHSVGRAVEESASRLGIGDLVHVQPVRLQGVQETSRDSNGYRVPARARAAVAVSDRESRM